MILCDITPLNVTRSNEDPLYKLLEIHMQRLGFLIPFREKINWDHQIEVIELGEYKALYKLQKLAARNDGVPLFMAKWFKKTVFQHLILHPNSQGYYIPFRFDEPFHIDLNNEKYWLGSSIRLNEELSWLEIELSKQGDEETIAFWKQFKKGCEVSESTLTPFKLVTE